MKIEIDEKISKRVKDLKRDKMSLKQIKKETGLTRRQVRYILYEQANPRVVEIKANWIRTYRMTIKASSL